MNVEKQAVKLFSDIINSEQQKNEIYKQHFIPVSIFICLILATSSNITILDKSYNQIQIAYLIIYFLKIS